MSFTFWVVLAFIAKCLDNHSTYLAITKYPQYLREANPFVFGFFHKFGVKTTLIAHLVLLATFSAVCLAFPEKLNFRILCWEFAGLTAVFSFCAYNNYRKIYFCTKGWMKKLKD